MAASSSERSTSSGASEETPSRVCSSPGTESVRGNSSSPSVGEEQIVSSGHPSRAGKSLKITDRPADLTPGPSRSSSIELEDEESEVDWDSIDWDQLAVDLEMFTETELGLQRGRDGASTSRARTRRVQKKSSSCPTVPREGHDQLDRLFPRASTIPPVRRYGAGRELMLLLAN